MLYMAGAFVLYAFISLTLLSDASAMFYFCLTVAAFGLGWLLHEWTKELWLVLGWGLIGSTIVTFPFLQWGLFGNPNAIGCAFVLCLAAAVAYRCWFMLPFLFTGIVWTGSRGAIAIAGALGLVTLFRHYRATALVLASLAILFIAIDPRGSSSFAHRLGVWQDTLSGLTLFGNGLGNWHSWYIAQPVMRNATAMVGHAYNDPMELLWSFGIGTIPLWLFFVWAFEIPSRERLILGTFLGLGLSFFPMFLWPLTLPFAFTLGAQAHARYAQQPLAQALA